VTADKGSTVEICRKGVARSAPSGSGVAASVEASSKLAGARSSLELHVARIRSVVLLRTHLVLEVFDGSVDPVDYIQSFLLIRHEQLIYLCHTCVSGLYKHRRCADAESPISAMLLLVCL